VGKVAVAVPGPGERKSIFDGNVTSFLHSTSSSHSVTPNFIQLYSSLAPRAFIPALLRRSATPPPPHTPSSRARQRINVMQQLAGCCLPLHHSPYGAAPPHHTMASPSPCAECRAGPRRGSDGPARIRLGDAAPPQPRSPQPQQRGPSRRHGNPAAPAPPQRPSLSRFHRHSSCTVISDSESVLTTWMTPPYSESPHARSRGIAPCRLGRADNARPTRPCHSPVIIGSELVQRNKSSADIFANTVARVRGSRRALGDSEGHWVDTVMAQPFTLIITCGPSPARAASGCHCHSDSKLTFNITSNRGSNTLVSSFVWAARPGGRSRCRRHSSSLLPKDHSDHN
jgi:hypothetical protein